MEPSGGGATIEPDARRNHTAIRPHQQLRTDTGTRDPAKLREEVLAHAIELVRCGESVKSIAAHLGVRPQLLAYWKKRSSRMRRVEIQQAAEPGDAFAKPELVVVTSGGVRVEGLELRGVVELLRALS